MQEEMIVQFVCFETPLESEQFIIEWEQFTRSVNSDMNVVLQQSENKRGFRYIAQHRCKAGEFQFVFTRRKRSSKVAEVEISAKQAGGYSVLQFERKNNALADENKVFAFLTEANTDLSIYKEIPHTDLNIYEAYYENCQYAYVLEFFVKNSETNDLVNQLKQYGAAETAVYKECALQAS
jgi:hypothetical protein